MLRCAPLRAVAGVCPNMPAEDRVRIVKIATYNVNSIRSRLPVVIPWLEQNRPDVLCLQEPLWKMFT